MKKIIALLTVIVMAFGLVGCSSTADGVSQEEYDRVVAERDALKGQLSGQSNSVEVPDESKDPKPTPTADQKNSNEFMPLELKEYSYSVIGSYLNYAIVLHNPNEQYAVEFPTIRITARDQDGLLLGTDDQVLSIIYPQEDFVYTGTGFEVKEPPSKVEFEVVAPDDYNILQVEMIDHGNYIPMEITGTVIRDRSILGEVNNSNDYDIDGAIVSVVFRDDAGKILVGGHAFIGKISAGGSVPFEIKLYGEQATENYEVYANIW